MSFYEHTLVAKQDLSQKDLDGIEKKYNDLINQSSGKVIKLEKWGLINFSKKIKNYQKGYYLHFKFEGNSSTLEEIKKKVKLDKTILRDLIIKYKKLDTESEYFSKDKEDNEKTK